MHDTLSRTQAKLRIHITKKCRVASFKIIRRLISYYWAYYYVHFLNFRSHLAESKSKKTNGVIFFVVVLLFIRLLPAKTTENKLNYFYRRQRETFNAPSLHE